MSASAKNEKGTPAFGPPGPEILESMATLGRDAVDRTMRLAADATVRAFRGAATAGTAQLEAAQALREKMSGNGKGNDSYLTAFSASSEAAIAGIETCMEKAIDGTRAATDAGIETVGRSLAARTMDDWLGVQVDSATRMMELGLAQAGDFARIVTETSARCADPFTARAGTAEQAS